MMVSSSANASSVAERSFSPLPTMARSSSDETISRRAKRAAAQADLPAPDAPTRTISAGSGSVAVAGSTVTRVAVGSGLIGRTLHPPQAQAQPDVHAADDEDDAGWSGHSADQAGLHHEGSPGPGVRIGSPAPPRGAA